MDSLIKVVPETHKVHKQVLNLNARSLILIGIPDGLGNSGGRFEVKQWNEEDDGVQGVSNALDDPGSGKSKHRYIAQFAGSASRWVLGNRMNISSRDSKKEEVLWCTPIGKQVAIHELSQDEAAGFPDEASISRPIDFVSTGYIRVGRANYTEFECFHIFSLDDGAYEHPIDISSLVGPASWTKLSEEKPEGSVLDGPVSMQNSCNVEVEPVNWDLVRNGGYWLVQGWGPVGGACNGAIQTYLTTIPGPARVASFDELPVMWEQVTKALPLAVDAFEAPTWECWFASPLKRVIVGPVTQTGIGKLLARSPVLAYEKPVMAQWAVGKFVLSWTEQFQHFKANAGPYHELPDK